MKKILIILPDLDVGGVTSSALNFINILCDNGYDVSLLDMSGSIEVPYSNIKSHKINGFRKYWNLRTINKRNIISLLFSIIIALLKKILNKFGYWYPFIFYKYKFPGNYDVVVAFRQCEPCYYFALYCVDSKIKIGMIHGNIDFMGNIDSWSKYFPSFNYVACVSNAVTNGFKKSFPYFKDKFVTIYNMFDIEGIKRKASESINISFNKKLINIVSVARQENGHKQTDRIPLTCKLLKDMTIDNLHWYVVGDGPDLEKNILLAKQLGIENMITYCGSLTNPFPIIKECDFLVLTSKTESFGMVLKEAHILGKPVVAMRYDGIEEIFEDNVTGIVAEQNIESLAEKIILLIKDNMLYLKNIKKNISCLEVSNSTALKQFSSLID